MSAAVGLTSGIVPRLAEAWCDLAGEEWMLLALFARRRGEPLLTSTEAFETTLGLCRICADWTDVRCDEHLDNEDARLPASRLDLADCVGLAISGNDGSGRLGAFPGDLQSEIFAECDFVVRIGSVALESLLTEFDGVRDSVFREASIRLIVPSVSELFPVTCPNTKLTLIGCCDGKAELWSCCLAGAFLGTSASSVEVAAEL